MSEGKGMKAIVILISMLLSVNVLWAADGGALEKNGLAKDERTNEDQGPLHGIEESPPELSNWVTSDRMPIRPSPIGLSTDGAERENMASAGSCKGLGLASIGEWPDGPSMMTRASDEEREQNDNDFANGSRMITPMETVAGTLSYDPDATSDSRDWYKLALDDVDPAPNSADGVHNVSFHLNLFQNITGGYSGLYEYKLVPTAIPGEMTLENEYADFLNIMVIYYDPWMGYTNMGGNYFMFDDMDDSDSWSWRFNWTFDFTTPIPSTGAEDLDGFANGNTEVGWYYIGLSRGYYYKTTDTRGAYTISYSFTMDTSRTETTDDGSNSWGDASYSVPQGITRMYSAFDQMDWYKFKGVDDGKLWNMTFSINRTLGAGDVIEGPTQTILYDTWMYVFVIWRHPGEDGLWNTGDDAWEYIYWIFSFFITGGIFVSNTNDIDLSVYNRWTESNDRNVYVATYVEPAVITVVNNVVTGFRNPYWTTFNEYRIDLELREELPNRGPDIKAITIDSSNAFYETWGDVRDTFTFSVVYQDPDNDPPGRLDLFIDPGMATEKYFDIIGNEKDPKDSTYSDGKTYTLVLKGDKIGAASTTHDVLVNATDRIADITSIRLRNDSPDKYLNDTLRVFDDQPVSLNTQWTGYDPMDEDAMVTQLPLEKTNGGPFYDPERKFRGFMVWNTSSERWSGDHRSDLLHVNVSREGGGWFLEAVPEADMHGSETIEVYAYDDHSHVTLEIELSVISFNDPPVVLRIESGGNTYSVLDTDPTEPIADLRGALRFEEDKASSFKIVAEDTDPDIDDTPLIFEYLKTQSDAWSKEPMIGRSTGEVTFTPTNDDVVRERTTMAFSVSDGRDSLEITVKFSLLNKNDPPTLTVIKDIFSVMQNEEFTIRPLGADIDPDEVLTYSVNVEQPIGTEYDSLLDQLPFVNLDKGTDWSISPSTGQFWFVPRSDDIWRKEGSLLMENTVHLVFQVSDRAGLKASVDVTLLLKKSDPWIPPTPEASYEVSVIYLKEGGAEWTVNLSAEAFDTTLYGSNWDYSWNLGDGKVEWGRVASHTYYTEGVKRVFLSLKMGEYESPSRLINITLVYDPPPPPPPPPEKDGLPVWLIIVIIVAALSAVAVVLGLVLMKRRQPQPPQQPPQYYGRQEGPLGPAR